MTAESDPINWGRPPLKAASFGGILSKINVAAGYGLIVIESLAERPEGCSSGIGQGSEITLIGPRFV